MDDAFSLHEVRSPIVAVIVSVTLGYWILLGRVFALFSRFTFREWPLDKWRCLLPSYGVTLNLVRGVPSSSAC
jgi:hypothetical protein